MFCMNVKLNNFNGELGDGLLLNYDKVFLAVLIKYELTVFILT